MAAFVLFKFSILVSFCAVTKIVKSTSLTNNKASVTINAGGASKIITSNFAIKLYVAAFNLFETINSDGFGGLLPAVITYKFLISVS